MADEKLNVSPSVHKPYPSAILDLCDRRIVSFVLQNTNNSALVYETLDQALAANQYTRPTCFTTSWLRLE